MFVNLKPLGLRREHADQVIARLRGKLAAIPGATLYLQAVQDLRVGGRVSNAQYQYTLRGESVKDLNAWAPRVYNRLRTLLIDVNGDQQVHGSKPRGHRSRDRCGLGIGAADRRHALRCLRPEAGLAILRS